MPRVAKSDEKTNEINTVEATSGQTAMLEVPLSEPYSAGFPIHVNLNLDAQTGMTLRRIARGYDRQHATLKNGRRVVDATTALRKLLEDIADHG